MTGNIRRDPGAAAFRLPNPTEMSASLNPPLNREE
jgi:hypothetical protein